MSVFKLSAESLPSAQHETVKVRPLMPSSYIITHSASKRQNIGTLVRCATAFGVKEVCLVGSHQFNTAGSQGSGISVAFKYFNNLKQCVMHLKDVEGCRVLGVEICEGAQPVQEHPFSGPTAFLLGNEGQGLSAKQMALCDGFVYIPQHGPGTASLNAATAASIVLHHFAVWADYPEREHGGSKLKVFDEMDERPLRTAARGVLRDSDDLVLRQRQYHLADSPDPPSTPSLAGSISSKSGFAPNPSPAPAVRVWSDAAVLVVAVADYAGLCRMLLPLEMADLSSRIRTAFERATVAHGAVVIETSGGVMSAAMLPAPGFTEDGATAGLRLAALHRLGRALLDAAAMVSVPATTSSLQLQMSISLGNLMGHSPVAAVPTFSPSSCSSPPAMLYFGPLLAELLDLARRAPPMTIVAPDGEAAALRASGATADIRGPLFLEADDSSTAGSVGGAPSSASGGGGNNPPRRRVWLVEAHPLAYQFLPPQLLHGMTGGGPSNGGEPNGNHAPSRRAFAGIFNSLGLYGSCKPQHISSTSPSRAASLALELESASARGDSLTSKKHNAGGPAESVGKGSTGGKAPSVHSRISSRSSSCSGTCVTFSLSAAAAGVEGTKPATTASGSPTPASGSPSPGASFLYATSPTPSHGLPSLGLELATVGSGSAQGLPRRTPGIGRLSGGSSGLSSLQLRRIGGTGTGDSELSGGPSEQHFHALRTELAMMRQQLQALQVSAAASRIGSRGASLIFPAGAGPIRRQLGASVLQHLVLRSSVSPASMSPRESDTRALSRRSRVIDLNTGGDPRKHTLAPWEKSLRKVTKIARLFFGKISKTISKARSMERGRQQGW